MAFILDEYNLRRFIEEHPNNDRVPDRIGWWGQLSAAGDIGILHVRSLPHPHPGEHDREMPWWKWAPLPQFVKDVPHARVSRHCASKDPCDVRTGFAQEELLYLEDSSGTVRAVRRGADVDMHFQAGVAPSAFLAGWLQDPKRAWAVWDARVRAEHPDGGTIYVPLL